MPKPQPLPKGLRSAGSPRERGHPWPSRPQLDSMVRYAARRPKDRSRASTFSSTLAPARKSPSGHFPVHARAGSAGAHSIVGSSDKTSRVVRGVRTVDTGASEVRNDLVFEHFPLCTVSPSVSPAREHGRPLSRRNSGARAAVLLGTAQGHHDTHPSQAAPRAEAVRARTTRWTVPTMRGVGRAVSRRREGVNPFPTLF